jgi:hypothetical protein
MHGIQRFDDTADDSGTNSEVAAVSAMLWTERETLELLLFKLTVEQLVLASGSTRWLNRADADVRAAVARLRTSEVVRAAEVESLSKSLGMPVETTLADLAEGAPEPWPMVLTDHRTALRALVLEVEAVANENRRLLDAGSRAIRETLDNLSTSVSTYDATGVAVGSYRGPFLLDEQA